MTPAPAFADPEHTIAFQGAFGAYSDLACRNAFPEMTTLPCPRFDDAFAAVRQARDDPDREFARRTRRRHPSPDAEFGAAHHCRAFRAGEAPSARRARHDDRQDPHGQEPYSRPFAMPHSDPRIGA